MYAVFATEEFVKRYQGLPLNVQRKVEKQQKFIEQDPFHPSLHTEKLQPKRQQYWSMRVDKRYRIIFRFLTKTEIILITVGAHDWVYRLM